MEKVKVSNGSFWVEIPEADIRILCGCPADCVKHLMNKGLILTEEKNGVVCETGPNVILLSEVFLQNGQFSNLGEFPVLQMLYRQGMILPNHPNNTGKKPILVGREESITAQSEYIYRGNYGLTSLEELLSSGVDESLAETIMRIKLKFAFDNIVSTDELIDKRIVDVKPVEIANEVFVTRIKFNVYEIRYHSECVVVDLNLGKELEYEPPYQLGHYQINKEYFSIIHSGEGDGWDTHRPCMASIITFQGKIYLIDAGPSLLHSLRALGIGISEIEGIFHTHAHDDHFNGLTTLMGSDHKIKYYAAPVVRQSTIKKFSALLSIPEEQFATYFETFDLKLEEWNDIGGLEVRPVLSPHPVETTIMHFRALWGSGYKSYAHLADVSSSTVLDNMVEDDPAKSGMTQSYRDNVEKEYLIPATIKKIDIGGGMIHGNALDFREDSSEKILLSHSANRLSDEQREIGSNASFGMSDVLIDSTQDYTKQKAFQHFQDYFPTVPKYDIQMLLNCPAVQYNPGTIVIRKDQEIENIYFILSGIMEFVSSHYKIHNKLTVGSYAGELSAVQDKKSRGTFRAISHIKALEIPRNLYLGFLKRNNIYNDAIKNMEKRQFLQMTWLIGEQVSCPLKNRIARQMQKETVPQGWKMPKENGQFLYMLEQGEVELITTSSIVSTLEYGDFFGEENILGTSNNPFIATATKESTVWKIPAKAISNIPIIHWKLIEVQERRMKMLKEI